METRDIKGLLASLKNYATSNLEYDRVTAQCKITEKGYELEINCDDEFQRKGAWDHKVEQAFMSENYDWETPLESASMDMFERLSKLMKRQERELRYGLNLIGQSIEAAQSYRTHVGLEFLASMKQEQEKTMLMLPDRTSGNHFIPEAAPAPAPSKDESDDTAF